MKKVLMAVLLCGTVAVADNPSNYNGDLWGITDESTIQEINLSTMDLLAETVRQSADNGDRETMKKALTHLRDVVDAMLKDLQKPAPAETP